MRLFIVALFGYGLGGGRWPRSCNYVMVSGMRCLVLFPLLLSLPAVAQKIYVYPATVTAPRGSYQTVTAIVTGVNDKTVTWTSDGGTIVGTNPCVVNEPCTVALTTTTPGTYHLTGTSNSSNSLSATSTITFTGSPTPATTHPRLVITAAMVPGLRAKATGQIGRAHV